MNNEEKILALLEQLNQGQTSMQKEIKNLQNDVSTLKNDMEVVKKNVQLVERRLTSLLVQTKHEEQTMSDQ